jgi:hypothetical protein
MILQKLSERRNKPIDRIRAEADPSLFNAKSRYEKNTQYLKRERKKITKEHYLYTIKYLEVFLQHCNRLEYEEL